MLDHYSKNRKRPQSDPIHKNLDDLSNYKSAKIEIKPDLTTPTSAGPAQASSKPESGDFEDLEKEITPFGKLF